MERLNLEYYYGIESEQFSFLRVPRILIKDPRYKQIDNDGKLLYALLLDRMSLSQKKGWFDKEGRAYVYYTLDELQNDLDRSREKVVSEMNMLTEIGLIERKRQGQGKPSIIYVKKFATLDSESRGKESATQSVEPTSEKKVESRTSAESDFWGAADRTTGGPGNGLLKVGEPAASYTDKSYTEESKTYQSITVSEEKDTRSGKGHKVEVKDLNDPLILQSVYTDLIRDNVDYTSLIQEYPDDVDRIDELIRVMVNVICFGEKEYNINRCKVPAKVIASQFCKLDREHLIYALCSLKKANTKLTNPEAYMVATLYTARNTSLNDTLQQFNYDTRGYPRNPTPQEEKKDDIDWDKLVSNW